MLLVLFCFWIGLRFHPARLSAAFPWPLTVRASARRAGTAGVVLFLQRHFRNSLFILSIYFPSASLFFSIVGPSLVQLNEHITLNTPAPNAATSTPPRGVSGSGSFHRLRRLQLSLAHHHSCSVARWWEVCVCGEGERGWSCGFAAPFAGVGDREAGTGVAGYLAMGL